MLPENSPFAERLIRFLVPFFLTITPDLDAARMEVLETLASYGARTRSEFLNAALERIDAIQTQMLDRLLTELDDVLDIVFISDDMGSQKSLLISLPAWDRFFRERLTRWCELIHRHGKKVLFHTDGAARDIVPRLITAGIDILNPIQHICPGMDRAALKKDFGQQVIFHGGVENQHVLPFGTTREVVDEVRACMETLGAGGQGYICSSCHNIQAGTPVENVLAMIDTVLNQRDAGPSK